MMIGLNLSLNKKDSMLFRLSETIEKVKRAGFSGDSLIYRDKSGNVVSIDDNGTHTIAQNMKDFVPGISFLFCFTQERALQVYNKKELIGKFEGPFSAIHFFINGNSVVIHKKEPEGGKYIRFDSALNATPFDWYNTNVEDVKGNYFFVREES